MAASSGASSATTTLLPPVKSVMVYRNGDPFYCGRRFVVNQRQVATMEVFLNEVTLSIGAPLAVRTLFTPRQGHRVRDLQELQTGGQYVAAAGYERFKKLDYLNTSPKSQPVAREGTQVRLIHRPNVSAKWRKFIPIPCIIHVLRNGDLLCPPFRFIIPRSMQQDLEQILSLVTEKVSLRTGAVRRLCSLEGVAVSSAEELETGHCYVAVGTERFKKLPYVELLISKAAERHYPGSKHFPRSTESRKAGSGPEDRYSDSALLESPESDGRRVRSTGDEATQVASQQAVQRRTGRTGHGEETSVFYARPVRVRKNQNYQPRLSTSNGPAQPSVFRRKVQRRREEVRGAEEIQEDENTTTELPVDQRVAEIVEDEDVTQRDGLLQNTEQQLNRKASTPAGSPVSSSSSSSSNRSVHKSDPGRHEIETDGETSQQPKIKANSPPGSPVSSSSSNRSVHKSDPGRHEIETDVETSQQPKIKANSPPGSPVCSIGSNRSVHKSDPGRHEIEADVETSQQPKIKANSPAGSPVSSSSSNRSVHKSDPGRHEIETDGETSQQPKIKANSPAGSPVSRNTPVDKRDPGRDEIETNCEISQAEIMKSEVCNENDQHLTASKEFDHITPVLKLPIKQRIDFKVSKHEGTEQQSSTENDNPSVMTEDDLARAEVPEPEPTSSNTRTSSSSSNRSRDSGSIHGKNRELEDRPSLKSSNSKGSSPQPPPSNIMEQSNHGGLMAEERGFIKDSTMQ